MTVVVSNLLGISPSQSDIAVAMLNPTYNNVTVFNRQCLEFNYYSNPHYPLFWENPRRMLVILRYCSPTNHE
jgi:hypothetical protein